MSVEVRSGTQYLYDSFGNWIAFRSGDHIYNPRGQWIGWFPRADCDEALDARGRYLGSIFPDDRFYRTQYWVYPANGERPEYRSYVGPIEDPGATVATPLPPLTEDLDLAGALR